MLYLCEVQCRVVVDSLININHMLHRDNGGVMYCAILDDNKVYMVSVSYRSIRHHVGSSIGSEDSVTNIASGRAFSFSPLP